MSSAPTESSRSTRQTSITSAAIDRVEPVGKHQWVWFVVSGICFSAATVMAFLQAPNPNPLSPSRTMWQRFTKPIERNAWRRLPIISTGLTGVYFLENLHGWAVGEDGTILSTSDGGGTWRVQISDTSGSVSSTYFADMRDGWAVGAKGSILATRDGGKTWWPQTSGRSEDLLSVRFVDKQGWSVGNAGTILATSDGGTTWEPQTSGTSEGLTSVHFVDARVGWAVGVKGTILATNDGGAIWKHQTSGISQVLASVYFVDARVGWAVGDGGAVLATNDGGTTWKPQTSGTEEDLASVHFADVRNGWVVGEAGTILATNDGGTTWKLQTSGTKEHLASVHFPDVRNGWVVGNGGTILATNDGGATWSRQTEEKYLALASVHFVDDSHGWALGGTGVTFHWDPTAKVYSAVGQANTLLSTNDGGATWWPQTSGRSAQLWSMYFVDVNQGWVVGRSGTILVTNDGGNMWEPQTSKTDEDLVSLHFVDTRDGWVVGKSGTILATNDGGTTWKPQTSGTEKDLASVHFADVRNGWVVGESGTILATNDGGGSWKLQMSGTKEDLKSVSLADVRNSWVVGDAGTILATNDGGSTWKLQVSGIPEDLKSVSFADVRNGWAVGDAGTILVTNDAGNIWKLQISGTKEHLSSVHFADIRHGSVVGGNAILITSSGGGLWEAPESPSRYPAPWYYVAVALCLLAAVPGLRPMVVVPPVDNAANRQVSDSPIGPGELDALGLGEIALGLSQFFRNLDTKPPLTVGVLGEWGQGKSSVMRLLEADLKKNGIHPVSFNAWHYQKEDHLLAYLLEAIRRQAVPKVHTMQGLRFRARLLGLRAARGRWTIASLVVIIAFCAGLLRHPENTGKFLESMKDLRNWSPETGGRLTLFGLSLGTAILLFKHVYEALTAFHVNPAALIKEAAGSASIKDLVAKTNLRMAFAKEFRDVTQALEPYRMVIFIDDLDRCNPRSVTQILESVNFLTSAGDCFVVMGLAKPQVEASVGLSFKEVAEEMGDGGDARKKRRDYAQQYLRKLINLEVKVPSATPEQQGVLLAGQAANNRVAKSYARRLADFGRAHRPVAWVAGTLVLAMFTWWYGLSFEEPRSLPQPAVVETPGPKSAVATAKTNPAESKNSSRTQDREDTVFVPGVPEVTRFRWVPVFPSLLLLGFGFWVFTRRPNEVIQDSKKFTEALEIWQRVIGEQYKTPREIKRFLNRIRYIAMRWRKPSLQKTLLERFADWLQATVMRRELNHQDVHEVDETGIVLMAALEGLGGKKATSNVEVSANVRDEILGAYQRHSQQFGELQNDWQRFREITGEVETN